MTMVLTPVDALDGDAVLALADAKLHLRVDAGDENALIGALRDAAIEWVELYVGRGLTERDWSVALSGFRRRVRLPMTPVSAVTAVSYLNQDGVSATVAPSGYRRQLAELWPAAGSPWPATGPGLGAVTVTFTAGYPTGMAPAPLITAVKMLLGHLYANREGVITTGAAIEVPLGVMALCAPYRTPSIG